MKNLINRKSVIVITFIVLIFIAIASLIGCKENNIDEPEKEEPDTTQYYTITYIAETGGSIIGEATQTIAYGENANYVSAVPDIGYQFVKWSDNEINFSRREENVTSDLTVTALFKKTSFEVSYKTDGNGTIEGNANQTVAYRENSTEVTATPNYGYRFLKWSDGNTNQTRIDIDVQSNLTVTAIFVNYYTVEYKTDGNGTIKGESSQNIIYGESATTVTAVPYYGYIFDCWSDGWPDITRTDNDIIEDKTIYAYFVKIRYSVKYIISDHHLGGIYGETYQNIAYGEDAREVIANPRENCAFMGWSDGVETLERQDKNITCDMTLTAYFGYSISYAVDGNIGGTIRGNCNQKLLPEDNVESVTAVADDGYIFAGWSDMQLTAERQDVAERNWEYIAYFELIEKTFKYNYGDKFGAPLNTTVTLNRYTIENTKFAVPAMVNYKFCGWYADSEYATKVVNENGKLMLGYYTFTLETDTLYAKWQSVEEEIITFKVLIVMVDEVHASLLSSVTNDYVDVDYKMSAIERKILSLVPNKLEEYLNEWFDGKVIFEFDTYYTIIPLGSDSIVGSLNGYLRSYGIFANDISEVNDILADYSSIITTFGLNDYSGLLHSVGGAAGKKYAYVHIESILLGWNINFDSLQEKYYYLKNNTYNYIWVEVAEGHLHEFTHTIEQHYVYGTKYEFHSVGAEFEAMKQYLLCQFDSGDGKLVGIPDSFWMNPECWDEDWLYEP